MKGILGNETKIDFLCGFSTIVWIHFSKLFALRDCVVLVAEWTGFGTSFVVVGSEGINATMASSFFVGQLRSPIIPSIRL